MLDIVPTVDNVMVVRVAGKLTSEDVERVDHVGFR